MRLPRIFQRPKVAILAQRPGALPPLIKPDGRRLSRSELTQPERSGPTLGGIRQQAVAREAKRLTPARAAAVLEAAIAGDWEAFLTVAEEMEELDPHYQAVLSVRKNQVAQLPITVEAASDDPEHVRHADFLREWVESDVLRMALFDVLDAVGKGFSVHEIRWHSGADGHWPDALHYRPQRWFKPDLVELDTPKLRQLGADEDLADHLYLVHRHPSKSGLTIRSGVAFLALWSWMLKRFSDADWAAFVERYGMPFRLGKYDPTASDADREVLWRAVSGIAGDTAAIVPKSMEVEFVEAMKGGSAGSIHMDRAEYLDRLISKLVLGQTTTTDAVSGGHAVSQEHRLVQEDVERADAGKVSATLNRPDGLAQNMIAFNFGPQRRYPRIRIGRTDELAVPVLVDAISKLVPVGFRIGQSVLRDRLGLEEPGADEEVLQPPAAPGMGLPFLPPPGGRPAPAPVDAGAPPAAAIEKPADTGLNGAQVTAIQGIVEQYRTGVLPLEAAVRFILIAFPMMDEAKIRGMLAPITPAAPAPPAAAPPATLAGVEILFDRAIDARRRAVLSAEERGVEDALVARLAETAGPALAAQVGKIREAFAAADSLEDLDKRLGALKLDGTAFATAMRDGILLAELSGRAALLEELEQDGED